MTQTRRRGRWPFFILAGVLFLPGSATIKAEELLPSVAVDAGVEPGGIHKHDITLHIGEFVQLTVMQKTQDVIAAVFTPANEPLMEASNASIPSFKVAFIAKTEGQYRAEIRPRIAGKEIAQYRLTMDALRRATSADAETARGSLALHEANLRFAKAGARSDLLPSAISSYRQALTILASLDDREAEAGAYLHLGTAYSLQKNFDDAMDSYARAAELWRKAGDWKSEALALLLKIDANRGGGRYSEAIEGAKYLIDRAKEKGDAEVQTRTLTALTSVYSSAGEPELAIETQQTLLQLEPTQTTLNAAGYFENIAGLYLTLHETRTSIDYRRRAVSIFEQLGLTAPLATALARIAMDYSTIGETKLALQYSNAAVKLDPKQIDLVLLVNVGQTGRAIPLLIESIALLREQKSSNLAGQLLQLSAAYEKAMQPKLALKALDEALAAWRVNENPGKSIEFLAAVGKGYENLGEPGKALGVFQEFSRAVQAKGIDGFPQYPGFLGAMSRSERDLGMLDSAHDHLTTALDLREKARSRIASPELAASFFSQSRFIFDVYIDVLMRQGHEVEAFEASERSRAHSLISNLGATISKVREGVDPRLIEDEQILQRQINEAALQQARLTGTAKTQTTQNNVGQLTAQLTLLQGRIRQSSPAYASLTEPASLTLSEIQTKVLEPGTTLLEISLSDVANSYAWVVTTETLRGVKLPPRTEIEAAARRLRKSIAAKEIPRNETPSQKATRLRLINDFAGANVALSRMVLGPLGDIRTGQRLVIVTDGILDSVPFISLLDPKTSIPLIESHEVVKNPSASALAVLREGVAARNTKARNIAILADPVFDAQDERVALSVQSRIPVTAGALSRSLTETGLTIPRLLNSPAEARSIVEAAPQGSTFVFKGFEANRDFVSNGSLAGFRIVHFATHGLVDTARPALSGIVLSLVDKQGKPQDGFLRLHEIYNLHLNADLVVLSACETALGSQVDGEGVMSLSRGFFYAGAASVMASLWRVDDRATAELMRYFYSNLLSKKMSPAAALQEAQKQMRKSTKWSSPYYWAAFELQGEWK